MQRRDGCDSFEVTIHGPRDRDLLQGRQLFIEASLSFQRFHPDK